VSRVVAFVPDLMDRSKVQAAARAAGASLRLVGSPSELPEAAEDDVSLVVVDLSRRGSLEAVFACRGSVTVGFASHVDHELLEAARQAGCQQVLSRAAFFRRLGALLAEA
jgi:hypothetical protein